MSEDWHISSQLLDAFDSAWLVLTTFNVLQAEVHYVGDPSAGGASRPSDGLRVSKTYGRPTSPLASRTFWRLVIDEAQAVQSRSSSTLLARMAARIEAVNRWCATGTPLSLERGLADAYDVLVCLRCTDPLIANRATFTKMLHRVQPRASASIAASSLFHDPHDETNRDRQTEPYFTFTVHAFKLCGLLMMDNSAFMRRPHAGCLCARS